MKELPNLVPLHEPTLQRAIDAVEALYGHALSSYSPDDDYAQGIDAAYQVLVDMQPKENDT